MIGSRRATEPELRRVYDLLAAGDLRPTIHAVLPLAKAAEAHALLTDRRAFGKVVLQP